MNVEEMVFGRRYRATEKIGSGGMADVYKAVDEVLGRTVAVKVLDSRYASEPTFAARFRQEAQAAANLQSPYIVNIYDWGREGETYYIVMEMVRGTDLKTAIQQRGALDSKRVAEIGTQVCSALSVAHGYDVIHRDIKPHNIMVTGDGSVKVMDFGIARAGNDSMTQTGSVLGTAHYVSPEQAQGRPLTPGSDLYSLGVVLYELATGELPFDADTPVAVALKQVNETPARPSEVNPSIDRNLEAVIMKAMAKTPSERYETADEMRRDLLKVVEGRTVAAAPVPAAVPVPERASETAVMPAVGSEYGEPAPMSQRRIPPKRRKIWPWIILAVLLITGGLMAAWYLGLFEAEPPITAGTVPNVIGKTLDEAEAAIDEAGFTVGEIEREHSEEAEGVVLNQTPDAGEEAEPETAIDLVVSLGPEPVEVPTLIGMTEADAQQALEDLGLVARPLPSEFSNQFPSGQVMKQSPDPGTEVQRGSTVQYVTSRGVEVSEVPNVRGMTRAEAESTLRNAGFRVSVNEANSPDVPAGNVMDQNPGAGIRAEENSTVTIIVSRGPAPTRIEVPGLVGMSESEARAALEALGLRIRVNYVLVDNTGNVTEQSPRAGQQVDRNAVVTVTVDDGDEP